MTRPNNPTTNAMTKWTWTCQWKSINYNRKRYTTHGTLAPPRGVPHSVLKGDTPSSLGQGVLPSWGISQGGTWDQLLECSLPLGRWRILPGGGQKETLPSLSLRMWLVKMWNWHDDSPSHEVSWRLYHTRSEGSFSKLTHCTWLLACCKF